MLLISAELASHLYQMEHKKEERILLDFYDGNVPQSSFGTASKNRINNYPEWNKKKVRKTRTLSWVPPQTKLLPKPFPLCQIYIYIWHGLVDPTCVRSLGVVIWPYLRPGISTALMRPRRPKQYCVQLVIYIYIYIYIYMHMLASFSSLSTLAWLRWSHMCDITWGEYIASPSSALIKPRRPKQYNLHTKFYFYIQFEHSTWMRYCRWHYTCSLCLSQRLSSVTDE